MKELLYGIVELLAKIHSYLLRFNDAYEYNFSDKELHFLVIGILGMMFIFVVYPVFKCASGCFALSGRPAWANSFATMLLSCQLLSRGVQ